MSAEQRVGGPGGPAVGRAGGPAFGRRSLLKGAAAAALAAGFGPAFWRTQTAAAAAVTKAVTGPYGPLGAPDANGLRLPAGFRSRVVARAGVPIGGTLYALPIFPDGSATFPASDGGWIQVINSEVPAAGGASAIRYAKDGTITDAYRILEGTSTNCAGGPTPWGTWLSCEETEGGRIWECDPTGRTPAVVHPAMGVFKHEAACVEPVGERIYLTEDLSDGCFYRFTPKDYPSLDAGLLEVATVAGDGAVTWRAVPDPSAATTPTREQVAGATRFKRAEGIWFDDGSVYFATTGDETIRALRIAAGRIETVYAAKDVPGTPLQGVDNITVSRSGDLFVCEDSYDNDPDAMDVCMITREGEVARFAKFTGPEHFLPSELESEITGVAFSPDGSRMYAASQRAGGVGAVYEITGPFRTDRPVATAPPTAGAVLGLAARSRISATGLLDGGLRVALTTDRAVAVRVRLRARVRRGTRLRTVTLGATDARLAAGTRTVSVRVRSKAARGVVRGLSAPVVATLEVAVRGGAGAAAVRRRSVRVTATRRATPTRRRATTRR
ncbi:alkaline phosphatase PhoX [Patulibacter minatonensis]|uniref:alkaline phosphatase PhoX n=1 Tax=Patulibacter minatonensis TaxID=298163 RepID=UPI000A01CC8A|nr:alkaline phosphatase PhoX [Patulibacter minatonensis]